MSSHLLSVVAVATAIAATSWVGSGKPGQSDDDGGLVIPGLGDGAVSCGVTPSDPRNKQSCNYDGADGADGEPGSVSHDGYDGYDGEDV